MDWLHNANVFGWNAILHPVRGVCEHFFVLVRFPCDKSFFFLPKCFMFILSFAHFTSLNSMLFTNTSPQILSRPETDVDVSSSRLISKMCCWLIRMLSKKKSKRIKPKSDLMIMAYTRTIKIMNWFDLIAIENILSFCVECVRKRRPMH